MPQTCTAAAALASKCTPVAAKLSSLNYYLLLHHCNFSSAATMRTAPPCSCCQKTHSAGALAAAPHQQQHTNPGKNVFNHVSFMVSIMLTGCLFMHATAVWPHQAADQALAEAAKSRPNVRPINPKEAARGKVDYVQVG